MQKLTKITEEQKQYAIDLLVTLVVEELSEKWQLPSSQVLNEFIASETGQLLYDESSKLWWNGPSYIAALYEKEKHLHQ